MKKRVNVIVVALLILVGGLLWTIGKVRRAAPAPVVVTVAVPSAGSAATAEPAPVTAHILPAQNPVAAIAAAAPSAPTEPAPVASGDPSTYTARVGDTVADIAAGLPGGSKKINRDAVIAANVSLQQNPDRVLAGRTYTIPAADAVPELAKSVEATPAAVDAGPAAPAAVAATDDAPQDSAHQLKYSARPGDTVSTLAGALLGSDSKANRDAIVAANTSLQSDPDHLIADKTYRIPVRAGQPLAAAPEASAAVIARPATEPDADAVVQAGSGRELQYVAQPGDTVATLANELLGSDTQANKTAIINSNASLRDNANHVVAGKTYWIPAPAAPQPD